MNQEILYLVYMALSLGPFLPWLIWTPIALLISIWIAKRFLRMRRKALLGFALFLLILLLPFSDFIAGRIYFNKLCDTQYGFKVYHTVELPEQYWDEDGEPLFIKYPPYSNSKVNGTLNYDMLPEYEVHRSDWIKYSEIFDINQSRYWYFNKNTNEILADNTSFNHGCGWLMDKFTTSCGTRCDSYGQPNTKQKILSIFIRDMVDNP